MSDFDVHVPKSLIEAPFPDWVKLVWMRIRGYQGRNDWANCFQKTIAEDLDKDAGNVSVAIQVLEAFGWIERDGRRMRCKTGAGSKEAIEEILPIEKPSQRVQEVIEIVCDTIGIGEDTIYVSDPIGLSPIKIGLLPTGIGEDTTEIGLSPIPTESQLIKLTIKANLEREPGNSDESPDPPDDDQGDKPLEYPPDSWQRKWAARALTRFEKCDALSQAVDRIIGDKGREYVIQDWADTLRLCVEQDGYEKDEIGNMIGWLFEEDDFWIGKGLRSLSAIRSKKPGEDERKIDKIHGQWKAWRNNGRASKAKRKRDRTSGSGRGGAGGDGQAVKYDDGVEFE